MVVGAFFVVVVFCLFGWFGLGLAFFFFFKSNNTEKRKCGGR